MEPSKPSEKKLTPNSGRDQRASGAAGYKPRLTQSAITVTSGTKLVPGRPEMLQAWLDSVSEYIEQNFNVHRDIIVKKQYETAPAEVEVPGNRESAATLENYKQQLQIYNKKVQDIEQSKRKLFAYIWSRLSEESRDRVKRCSTVSDPINRDDPLVIVNAILTTHTMVDYSGNAAKDKKAARDAYHNIRQSGKESVIDFKNRFLATVEGMKTAKASVPSDSEMVQDFLEALDKRRFGQLTVDIANGIVAFPASVEAARRLAESRFELNRDATMRNPAAPARAVQAAFMSAAETIPEKQKKKKGTFPCVLCNSTEHRTYQCPFIERAKAVVREEQAHLTTSANDDGENAECTHEDDDEEWEPEEEEIDEDFYNPVAGYMVYKAGQDRRRFDDFDVLLDNQASSSVVHNADLLWNIRDADTPALFTGYGGTRTVTKVGEIPYFGLAYYDPEAPANLLSMTHVEDAFKVEYKQGETYTVHVSPKRSFVFGRRKNRHYTCNLKRFIDELRGSPQFAAVVTSAALESLYTREEVERAREAREFLRKLGYPSLKDAVNILRHMDARISVHDLYRAIKIYGEDPATWKGKSKDSKARPSEGKKEVSIDLTQAEQVMFADIASIEGGLYLVTFTSPLGLLVVSLLPGKSADVICSEGMRIVEQYSSRGFRVSKIQTDPEATFIAAGEEWRRLGIAHDTSGVNQHVPEVEVRIRVIKERCRCIVNDLPYQLPKRLVPHLVLFVVARINCMPSSIRMDPTPPREIFTNRRIHYDRDLSIGFGDFCIIQDFPEVKNSMEPRALEAISLCPIANTHGSVLFFALESRRIIARDKWRSAPMPPAVIDVMNKIATDEDGKKKRTYKASLLKAVEVGNVPSATFMKKAKIPGVVRFEDQVTDAEIARAEDNKGEADSTNYGGDISRTETVQPAEEISHGGEELEQDPSGDVEDPDIAEGVDQVAGDDEGHERPPPEPPPSHIYGTRYRGTKHPTVYYTGVTNDLFLFQVSFTKACKSFGQEEASKATLAELEQMEMKGVWMPVKPNQFTGTAIKSFLFLKEKFDASGNFQKLKARLVAGGNGQDPSLYPDKASPTASVQTIFILATVAARERRHVVTADIGSAYLNASMRGVDVFMKLDPNVSRLLVQRDPRKYADYVKPDGTIIVKLLKALYGCIESAKLWYETLQSCLVDYGLVRNPHDHCVFNKDIDQGQLTVAVYVDDLFMTCSSSDEIQQLLQHLRDRFGTLTVNEGKYHSYLGMNFDFSAQGKVRVSMEGFTHDLLKQYEVHGTVVTPATMSLFDAPNDATTLDDREAKEFHSCVAKLLYLAKRTRPDILTAVSFLSTRVSKPTNVDSAKLRRVLQYLNGTPHIGIVLEQTDTDVKAYIDASFAVHPDLRSHTGIFVTLGKGPIFVGSSKQKINTKSSTEAEVVGLSDKLGEVIWIRNFLLYQCNNQRFGAPAVVFQDNMSAIALIEKGKSMSSTTKHINIRYFFIKDKTRTKEVEIRYVNTKEMIADILTKPLQGRLFRQLRQDLMNDDAISCASRTSSECGGVIGRDVEEKERAR